MLTFSCVYEKQLVFIYKTFLRIIIFSLIKTQTLTHPYSARSWMFRVHIGDTPNNLSEEDIKKLGIDSAGFSGSDISVVVREALMEPLRIAQHANYFEEDKKGFLTPLDPLDDPPCAHCPMTMAGEKKGEGEKCSHCGSIKVDLYHVTPEQLKVPDVTREMFVRALKHSNSSVAPEELTRFESWTKEFGQEGV